MGRVVVNRWPGTVPKLSASDVVAEGACGRIATLKWRTPIMDGLCQYRPMDQRGMCGWQSSSGSVGHRVHQIAHTPPMRGSQELSGMEDSL